MIKWGTEKVIKEGLDRLLRGIEEISKRQQNVTKQVKRNIGRQQNL
jgi:hypothetical protein